MKDNKLIILYILMLVIGFILLFSNSSSSTEDKIIEAQTETHTDKGSLTEMVTVAVAKTDIPARTIITPANYYFKTIEVNKQDFNKSQYIFASKQIDEFVAKNNIEKESLIQHKFLASPNSPEYLSLSLKTGEYIFPIDIAKEDTYLLNNLKTGDLIDIYVAYSSEQSSNIQNSDGVTLVSPARNFLTTKIKPLIVSKKILFIENETNNEKQQLGRINLALSNDEIKLVRTLMTNATIILYPSNFTQSLDDGMIMLSEQEKGWPLSERQILNYKKINMLRGN
ncbi:hypothetical protein RHO13_04535 [Orbus wheelerorum]|uniref:hypothetical protein n=1 Tax=Orbus wheelerorum TaxID=3074111 RepID=UPI00370D8C9B